MNGKKSDTETLACQSTERRDQSLAVGTGVLVACAKHLVAMQYPSSYENVR